MNHAAKHLWFPEATVEVVTKFRQVTGQMVWTDAIMDATNIALDIDDQGMDPRKDPIRHFSRTGNEPFISGANYPRSYPLANRLF